MEHSSHDVLSSAQLIAQACSSLECSSSLLIQAATDISSATALLNRGIISRTQKSKKSSPLVKEERPRRSERTKKPTISPYFPEPAQKPKQKKSTGPTTSPFFPEPFSRNQTPPGLPFKLKTPEFGLIQERICESLFALVVQAILWNKTKGTAARPILWKLLCTYTTPEALAAADPKAIEDAIRVLGLQERRALCLVKMANVWIAAPPCAERRYGRRNYPKKGGGKDVKDRELLGPDDPRDGWEIGHLPGVGEYALDSYRIFGRDRLRGVQDVEGIEPEWKRVVPGDKELGPYVRFKWAQEGWEYDIVTGARVEVP